MSLFAPVLPAEVRTAERRGDLGEVRPAYIRETEAVATATPQRQREHWTGRALAREALAELGYPPGEIARGPRGEPLWPAGVVGSITHCPGLVAAAVGRADRFASVGIDAEPYAPLSDGVAAVVASVAELADVSSVAEPVLILAAKEAVFKAWWPIEQRELDFAQVRVRPAGDGVLAAEVDATGWDGLQVRWRVAEGLVLAGVVVSREAVAAAPGTAARRRTVVAGSGRQPAR